MAKKLGNKIKRHLALIVAFFNILRNGFLLDHQ